MMEFKLMYKSGNKQVNINIPVEVEFVVSKKNRVVVAKAFPRGDEAFTAAQRMFSYLDLPLLDCFKSDSHLFEQMVMPPKLYAVARCHITDVFSEKEGLRIAEEKMKEKLQKAVLCRIGLLRKALAEDLARMDTLQEV